TRTATAKARRRAFAAEQVDLRANARRLAFAVAVRGRDGRGTELIKAAQDPLGRTLRHRLHRVVFVAQRQVVEDALAFLVHAADAVLDDDRDLVSERRVVGQ